MKYMHRHIGFLLLCGPAVSHAVEINWSGFMSIAAGRTTNQGESYTVDPINMGAYTNELNFSPESIVGLQAQARISDKLRGTVQLVAKGANHYEPEAEWAYISYDLKENLTVNAGRFRLPTYYYSDFLDVGYAYYWIRPPAEIYELPVSSIEGVNLYHTALFGEIELNTQFWYGSLMSSQAATTRNQAGEVVTDIQEADLYDNVGISTLMTWEWLKLRLLYHTTDLRVANSTLDLNDDITYKAAAVLIDYENFLFRSEYTITENNTATSVEVAPGVIIDIPATGSSVDRWYASVGYTLGDFTPHITYAKSEPDDHSTAPANKTKTVGVAWDFHPSAVLKLEYLESEYGPNMTFGTPGGKPNVIATSIDIMF